MCLSICDILLMHLSDDLHLFLVIDRAALLGVGRWGGLSSHIFPGGSIMVGILSSGFFLFSQSVQSNTLAFWQNIWGLRSILWGSFLIIFFQIFGGGSEVVGRFVVSFRSIWLVRYSWISPLFLLGCRDRLSIFLVDLLRASCPFFSLHGRGSEVLRIGLLCNHRQYSGKSSPFLLFSLSRDG